MARLVECIPNFSCSKEKDEATYNALVEAAKSVPGCTLFDAQTDGNHNRCVFTLIGSPEAIEEVAFQLTKVATERIDMNHHKGEHKRMGATDVIPLVPRLNATFDFTFVRSRGTEIYAANKAPPLVRSEDGFRHRAGLEQAETEQNGVAHNAPNGVDGIPGNRYALDQHRINGNTNQD